MIAEKTIVVTGGNKGIGYAMIERIAKDHPNYELIMAVRTVSNGEEAVKNLSQANPGLEKRCPCERCWRCYKRRQF